MCGLNGDRKTTNIAVELPSATCRRCRGSGQVEFVITFHGERNQNGVERCVTCDGLGFLSPGIPATYDENYPCDPRGTP